MFTGLVQFVGRWAPSLGLRASLGMIGLAWQTGKNAFRLMVVVLALVASLGMSTFAASAEPQRPNVLMIAVDDLNDWVRHLGGHPQTLTPHLDRLAARGVTFANAHCVAPACNPSRTALLTSLRPSTTGVYHNSHDWRRIIPDALTLPRYFRQHGYHVVGAGKIYHEAFRRERDWDAYAPENHHEQPPRAGVSSGVGGIRFAQTDSTDAQMADYQTVDYVIEQLNQPRDKPLFLACGLYKPHMAWNVPQPYFDRYPLESIVLPKVLDTDLDDVPLLGKRMARPEGDHAEIVKSGRWKEAVQAYLAATSFADAMVGRLLDALDRSPHRDSTIIVLWGDHGWHLGEKQHWRKFSLWEEATRSPLIVVAPGVSPREGVCRRPVDFLGVFPTLAELCGLPVPATCEGVSFQPLVKDPTAAWTRPAVTTHGYQNHAVRSERWRYIRYADGSEELYDHSVDPQEWTNLAGRSEMQEVKRTLAAALPSQNVADPGASPAEKKPAKKKAKSR